MAVLPPNASAATIRAHLARVAPGRFVMPDPGTPAHRADARAVRRADRADAPEFIETPEDAVTVRRSALPYYAADALTPVDVDDAPLFDDAEGAR